LTKPQATDGCPYLARFSRDVGDHSAIGGTLATQADLGEIGRVPNQGSPKRTWAEKAGRSPSNAFFELTGKCWMSHSGI
jgi:hypothetical protein